MSNQPPIDNNALRQCAHSIEQIYQQLAEPSVNWDTLVEQAEAVRNDIEHQIDSWMELDEHLDELVGLLVSETPQDVTTHNMVSPPPQETVENHLDTTPDTSEHSTINLLLPQNESDNDVIAQSLRKAMGFYDLWLFEDAATLFRQVLRYEPNNILAALFYAAAQTTQGHYDLARPYIDEIRRSNNRRYQCAAEEIAANGYFQEGNLHKAIDCLLRVVQWMPDYQDTWFNLGVCYTQLDDWSAAAGALSQVLDLDALDLNARELLIDVWLELHEYDAALRKVNEGLVHSPGHTGLLLRKARVYRHEKHSEQAKGIYREVLLHTPADIDIYDEYIDLCLNEGDIEQACALLKKSLSIVPDNNAHLLKLAVALVMSGHLDEAGNLLRRIPREMANEPLLALCQAQIESQSGNRLKASVLTRPLVRTTDAKTHQLAAYYASRLTEREATQSEAERF